MEPSAKKTTAVTSVRLDHLCAVIQKKKMPFTASKIANSVAQNHLDSFKENVLGND